VCLKLAVLENMMSDLAARPTWSRVSRIFTFILFSAVTRCEVGCHPLPPGPDMAVSGVGRAKRVVAHL